jgi:alkaline phosphatase D
MKFSALLLAFAANAIKANGFVVELDGPAVFAQTGEITTSSAVVMARCNSKLDSSVYIKYTASSRGSVEKLATTSTSASSDYTSHVLLSGLKDDTTYQYIVECSASGVVTKSGIMTFQTAPLASKPADVSFIWAGDLAGQGWGRSPNVTVTSAINGQVLSGGYVMFEVMRQMKPDFLIWQGDFIYADNKIFPAVNISARLGGGVWINNPAKEFVAISLEDFRSNYKYNFGDSNLQTVLQEVPVYAQWDDHEVVNNWYPGQVLYQPKFSNYPNDTSVDLMAANARQAFFEFWPIMGNKIYRSQRHGKHVEVFFIDLRSYRLSNVDNSQTSKVSVFGEEQLLWLKNGLKASTATWKIVSTHDPFTIVTGGPGDWDTFVQNDPKMLGREFELAELLEFIKTEKITGFVPITSDVHFGAVLSYDPARATGFQNFNPFYEVGLFI